MPCSRAVIDDVLARREPRDRGHAQSDSTPMRREDLSRLRHDIDAVDRETSLHRARSTRPACASVVVLPAPFGPSRPVIWPDSARRSSRHERLAPSRWRRRAQRNDRHRTAGRRRCHRERLRERPLTSIIATAPTQRRFATGCERRAAAESPAVAARSHRNCGVDGQRVAVVDRIDEAIHALRACSRCAITPCPAFATTTLRAFGPSSAHHAVGVARWRGRVECHRSRQAASATRSSTMTWKNAAGTPTAWPARRTCVRSSCASSWPKSPPGLPIS